MSLENSMAGILVGIALMVGSLLLQCAHGASESPPPIPTLSPPTACRTVVIVAPTDRCERLYSPDGHQCAECRGGAIGCIAEEMNVYCVVGSCQADPVCSNAIVEKARPGAPTRSRAHRRR